MPQYVVPRSRRHIGRLPFLSLPFGFTFALVLFFSCLANAQISTSPSIATVAGIGAACSSASATTGACGDGQAATDAQVYYPQNMVFDASGNMYFADQNDYRVRRVDASTGVISTVAGNGTACNGFSRTGNSCGENGPATQAAITPASVGLDGNGNLYIADRTARIIRKVDPVGIITTIAGTGQMCSESFSLNPMCGDGTRADTATFFTPLAISVDAVGNIYVLDTPTYPIFGSAPGRVRKIFASTGYIRQLAPLTNSCGNNPPIMFSSCFSMTLDRNNGLLYVADAYASNIQKIDANSGIATISLTGLSAPGGVAVDAKGTLYFSEQMGDRVSRFNAGDATKTVIAGTGSYCTSNAGVNACGDGGPAAAATFMRPGALAFSPSGALYISDYNAQRIRKVVPSTGIVKFDTTAVSSQGEPSTISIELTADQVVNSIKAPRSAGFKTEFQLGEIAGCTVDGQTVNSQGTICKVPVTFSPAYPGVRTIPLTVSTSTGNYTIVLIGFGIGPQVALTPGTLQAFAGNTKSNYAGDGGVATEASLKQPIKSSVDASGNLYIADTGNNVIRRVDVLTSVITTVAGTGTSGSEGDGGAATAATLNAPTDVIVDPAGNLYIAEQGGHRIRKVDANTGIISTVAGTGQSGFGGDNGPATEAKLYYPTALALDIYSNLYIADSYNRRIRKLDTNTGIITTVAGSGINGNTGDGGQATLAHFGILQGVAVDFAGNIYISDYNYHVVRKVNAAGIISTIVGNGDGGYNGDGIPANTAELHYPKTLALDAAGNLYIADSVNRRIRRVDARSGTITTVAGGAGTSTANNIPATTAFFSEPTGIAVDPSGMLYITDDSRATVYRVDVSSSSLSFAQTLVGSTSSDSPKTASISNTGNAPLHFVTPVEGYNPSISNGFTLNSTAELSCPVVSGTTSSYTMEAGAFCQLPVSFTPETDGSIYGKLVLLDDAQNTPNSMQIFSLIGTAKTPGDKTSTSITATPEKVGLGQKISITAKVLDQDNSGTTVSGSVTFSDTVGTTTTSLNSGSAVTLVSGTAVLNNVVLSGAGAHTITASYAGVDGTFLASSKTASVAVVSIDHFTLSASETAKAGSKTSVTVTAYNPDETVATGYTGTVHFTSTDTTASLPEDATLINGTGTFNVTFKKAGSQTVTVTDVASEVFKKSSSVAVSAGAPASVTVERGNNQSAIIGDAFETALQVKVQDATGNVASNVTVTFAVPSTGASAVLGSTTCTTANDGTCSVTATANGSASVESYTVSASVEGVTEPAVFSLQNKKKSTTVTTTPAATSIVYGQSLALHAAISPESVAGSNPSGSVTFYDGADLPLTPNAVVDKSAASYTVQAPSVGSHAYYAKYLGDGNFAASAQTAATASVNVEQATATLAGPTQQPVFIVYNQGGSIPVTISGKYAGEGIASPTGSISYEIVNATGGPISNGQLSIRQNGVAVFVDSSMEPGLYTVRLQYSGDENYQAITTPVTVALQVGQIQPTISWTAPAPILYGTTLGKMLNAVAVDGEKTVAGTYSYTIGTQIVTSATMMPAGTYTVNVNFTPTDATTYKTATGSVSLTVNKATPAISLTTSAASVLVHNAVTFTATVNSEVGTPTGSVQFLDGTTPVGEAPLNASGVAVLPVDSLSIGEHEITAVYAGDANFVTVTSTAVNQKVQDFDLAISASGASSTPTSQNILPGGVAIFNFTLTPTGTTVFPAKVDLSVSGLPEGATYTITPTSIAAGAGATDVTLTVNVPKQISMVQHGERLAPIALGLLLLPFSGRMRRRAGKLGRLVAMLVILAGGTAGLAGLTGCGASTGYFAHPQQTYEVTITGTSGALVHSTVVTLTVQ